MDNAFQFLLEKEEMWARMLVEVLEDNGIPCATRPVHGVGFTMKLGIQDSLQIFVPAEHMPRAFALAEELFCKEILNEDEFFEDDIE